MDQKQRARLAILKSVNAQHIKESEWNRKLYCKKVFIRQKGIKSLKVKKEIAQIVKIINTNDAKQMSHCEKPIPLENRDYYVVWDSAQLPVIKCNGKSLLSSWDDVVAVAFDTRIVDAEKEQTFLIRGQNPGLVHGA